MAVHFDKVPSFLYFNENGEGNGTLFIDGKNIKPLGTVNMHAQSNDYKRRPLHYRASYFDESSKQEKSIGDFDIFKIGTATVELKNVEPFISAIKMLLADERIPEQIRLEYGHRFIP